jgi:hypothetical protein
MKRKRIYYYAKIEAYTDVAIPDEDSNMPGDIQLRQALHDYDEEGEEESFIEYLESAINLGNSEVVDMTDYEVRGVDDLDDEEEG